MTPQSEQQGEDADDPQMDEPAAPHPRGLAPASLLNSTAERAGNGPVDPGPSELRADQTAGPVLEAGMRAGGWRQLTRRPNKRAAAADFFESDETSNPMEAEAKRIKAAEERAAAPRTTLPAPRLRLALTGRVLQTAATTRPTFEAAPMQHDCSTNPMAMNDDKENTPPPP